MAVSNKVYILGEDVEQDSDYRLARLLGISHEIYERYMTSVKNNKQFNGRITKYCFPIKEKEIQLLDENLDPVLDELGYPIYVGSGDYCLELNIDMSEYSVVPTVHKGRVRSRASMVNDGWFSNE